MIIKYDVKIVKNEGFIISPSELFQQYLYGVGSVRNIDLVNNFPIQSLKTYILSAQDYLEDLLTLKLQKQEITETTTFIKRDYEEWGFIQVSYPVTKPVSLFGFINNVRQISYPDTWLSARQTNDGKGYFRRIHIVPGGGSKSATTNSVVYSGISPHLGFMGFSYIPDYWRSSYQTGFDKVPLNIIQVVAKIAALPALAILGDFILGPGISGKSLSIDGLSQSITTNITPKNSAYGARMLEILRELKEEIETLKSVYVGYKFVVC